MLDSLPGPEQFLPAIGTAAATMVVLWLASLWITRGGREGGTSSIAFQFLRLVLLGLALLAVILLLPISDETQGQVLSLLGVVLTAVIALSSTTFVGNVMAGLMLQASNAIRPGDFIRVGEQFGRVTRRSLLQTRIQTEWRDLTTLPNLLLINNPVTVLHRDGTIISAELSLGYDIPYTQVENLLAEAASETGLEDPFVLVQELLDHAVSYRVAGFLPETKNLLTARSNLRKKALEILHGHGVEIVSPSFMVQRPLKPEDRVIPERPVRHGAPQELSSAPEERIFDKAEEAANLEQSRARLEELKTELKELKDHLKGADEGAAAELRSMIGKLDQQAEWHKANIKALMDSAED
jgi:small-conductance mechanosensitive channel